MFNVGAASKLSLSSMCDASIQQSVSANPDLPVGSLPCQHTFHHGDRLNQQMANESVESSLVSKIATDEVLSYTNAGSYQQMENPFFEATSNLPSKQLMFNPSTAHCLSVPTSAFVSAQSQLDQYYHRSINTVMQNSKLKLT